MSGLWKMSRSFIFEMISRFRIRCRQIVRLDHKSHVTEMRLQLYKVQEHAYLLDFQKLEGNVCSFMHMCGTVIDQLQKGLSRNAQLACRFFRIGLIL